LNHGGAIAGGAAAWRRAATADRPLLHIDPRLSRAPAALAPALRPVAPST